MKVILFKLDGDRHYKFIFYSNEHQASGVVPSKVEPNSPRSQTDPRGGGQAWPIGPRDAQRDQDEARKGIRESDRIWVKERRQI